jgi:hypothetical protein
MKNGLLSRLLATVVAALLLAWAMVAYSQNKLAAIARSSPDAIASHYRDVYSHGYVFHFISFVFVMIPILLLIEVIAAIIRNRVIDA